MLAFIVPLKSRRVAKSWDYVSRLFERSLRSMCNQTSPDFKVVVVCHERPEIQFHHPAVSYIEVDFPVPKKIMEMRSDRWRKIQTGIAAAGVFAPTHVMAVDGDDCVSNRLAELVQQNPAHVGWYFDAGYLYRDGGPRIHLKRRDFHRWCGTCNILRYDWIGLPEAPDGQPPVDVEASFMKERMARRGAPLERLPFPGAVYVGTKKGEGTYARIDWLTHLRQYPKGALRPAKRIFLDWFKSEPITPALAAEFGLYDLRDGAQVGEQIKGRESFS